MVLHKATGINGSGSFPNVSSDLLLSDDGCDLQSLEEMFAL
jgi:hypothetical protein